MAHNTFERKDELCKHLKRRLECWREVVLPINSILLWEKSWYPGLIFGLTTTVCLFIWIMEPAFLTLISISLLILALIDYLVPIIAPKFICSGDWNGQKERKLGDICRNLSELITQFLNFCEFISHLRNFWPSLYYGSMTICLVILAYIGNTVNNLLIIYLAVNAFLLTPGLLHKGRARAALKYASNYLIHRKSS